MFVHISGSGNDWVVNSVETGKDLPPLKLPDSVDEGWLSDYVAFGFMECERRLYAEVAMDAVLRGEDPPPPVKPRWRRKGKK